MHEGASSPEIPLPTNGLLAVVSYTYMPRNSYPPFKHFNATMSLLAASRRTAAAGLSRALAANRGVLAAADGASRSVVTMGRTEDTILPVSFLPCFLGSAEALHVPFVGWRGLGFFPEDMSPLLFYASS